MSSSSDLFANMGGLMPRGAKKWPTGVKVAVGAVVAAIVLAIAYIVVAAIAGWWPFSPPLVRNVSVEAASLSANASNAGSNAHGGPNNQNARSGNLFGADQPHMQQHPIETEARAAFDAIDGHPDLHGCFAPASDSYSPSQELLQENPALVPPYQQALRSLPAMRSMNYQQEFPGNNIGPNARQGIDPIAMPMSLDSTTRSEDDDFHARVRQTEGAGVSNIYRRGDGKGMSLINQKSRMVDPTKMLPNVDPSRQNERMVQAGPSISDIGCRVPKAADIMRLLRASRGSALSQTIPKDKPPVYTEGLNAFRPTPLPAAAAGGAGCTIGISPYEVSDLIDYCPNPFLYSSRAANQPYNYSVGPEGGSIVA